MNRNTATVTMALTGMDGRNVRATETQRKAIGHGDTENTGHRHTQNIENYATGTQSATETSTTGLRGSNHTDSVSSAGNAEQSSLWLSVALWPASVSLWPRRLAAPAP